MTLWLLSISTLLFAGMMLAAGLTRVMLAERARDAAAGGARAGREGDAPAGAPSLPPVKQPSLPPVARHAVAGLTEDDEEVTVVMLAPLVLQDAMSEEDEGTVGRLHVLPVDPGIADEEASGAAPLLIVAAVGLTHPGQKRGRNEDRFLVMQDQRLFAIADGMGGHRGGEIASQLALDTLAEALRSGELDTTPTERLGRDGVALGAAIQRANFVVYEASEDNAEWRGMGTTLVSLRVAARRERVYIGHVGDSRCYRLREGELVQLTTDHTLGAAGIPGPLAHQLARAVGVEEEVEVDVLVDRPRHDDLYLLCSDGLTKMLSDDQIARVLRAEPELSRAVNQLVQDANEAGGRDNVTVLLVRVTSLM